MRRSEFDVSDPEKIKSVLNECEYGVLSLISEGEPYGMAVNFAYIDGVIYFHGSLEGRKAEAIGLGTNASFMVVKPYAFIPSYFSDTRSASPATQFFASVYISGHVVLLNDSKEKAFGLTALMEKMQPEGGYDPIDAKNPIYTKMLEKTGVYKIVPNVMTLKLKAGQNLSKERYDILVQHLEKRDGAESETVQLVQSIRAEARI